MTNDEARKIELEAQKRIFLKLWAAYRMELLKHIHASDLCQELMEVAMEEVQDIGDSMASGVVWAFNQEIQALDDTEE